MTATVVTLISPTGNGAAIAAAASTPVVQAPAHPRIGSVIDFRVTCTKAHSYKLYGFTDAASTTLTDGAELTAVTGKAATSGKGYGVQVYSENYAGYALVVTNTDGALAADIGVDRIIRAT